MLTVFNTYNIPNEIRGYIFSFIEMRDEFSHVLYAIDVGVHKKILYFDMVETGYTNIYGFPKRVKRIVAARDVYRPQYWAFSPDAIKSKFKKNIYLSEKYSYTPDGWPSYDSQSATNQKCVICDFKFKYKDSRRNKILPVCECQKHYLD